MKKYCVENTCNRFINLTAFNSLSGKEKEDKVLKNITAKQV